ncbi:MAG TPA: hypothetical protein VGA44_02860, partial [Steroidobacteraceae bacterium]
EVDELGGVTRRRAWSISGGGCAMVYLLDEEHKDELRKQLKERFSKLEGVDGVLDVHEFARYGLPDPADNPQQADLMLVTGPGYSFDNEHAGTETLTQLSEQKGTHGHLPEPAYMHALFIAVGAGIKPGTKLDTISNLDVAPTIARLLGVKLPTAEGRVLTEMLTHKDK